MSGNPKQAFEQRAEIAEILMEYFPELSFSRAMKLTRDKHVSPIIPGERNNGIDAVFYAQTGEVFEFDTNKYAFCGSKYMADKQGIRGFINLEILTGDERSDTEFQALARIDKSVPVVRLGRAADNTYR